MSWHGPSAPRVEGIATKSRVVASWASKPASTASRILCCVSAVMQRLQLRIRDQREPHPNPISAAGVMQKIGIPQCIFEQTAFRITTQRRRPFDAIEKPRTGLRRAEYGANRNALGIDG